MGRMIAWTELVAWGRSRKRAIVALLAVGAALASRRGADVDPAAPSPESAIAQVLANRGLSCSAGDVAWVGSPTGVRRGVERYSRALVRARAGAGEPSDLYLVVVRVSPEGAVLEVGEEHDVTNTSGVDETRPIVRGETAAYTASADGVVTGIHVLDLRGRPSPRDFTFVQRQQARITNLQQTGQAPGLVHDAFALDPVAHAASLSWQDGGLLEARVDDHLVVIDPQKALVVTGEAFVRVVPDEAARPGNLVTWAVDRVRAVPSFGDDRMQWLKAVVFTAMDRWNAAFSHGTTAKEVEDELGLAQPAAAGASSGGGPADPSATADPEIGWPPAPMRVPVSPALPGEGKWISLDRDPFITPSAAGTPPAFVTSFVRPDPHRQDVRVYVTLWDPRQIALHMEAGTVEPISANGEHGSGMVPRTPEVMKRFVAGFNGGFQAQHGEYGMQSNGIEYLPPKPYAATVMELRDGSNAFGAWPGPINGNNAPAPDDVVAFRQNLTALVQDGRFNPWGRTWWGGTPPGWADAIHTARSAICMTSEGFVGYFYGASLAAEDLAQGMLDARCSFGIHLDMNPGHAGFEFYNVAPEGQLKPLGRPLQTDWEAEGKVPDMAPWVFRARRMIRGMGHMLFPRYVQREARDFFYLTSRPILPGAPIPPAEGASPDADEGVWRTRGLPQHGFPYALATAWAKAGDVKLRVVRADPRAMRPAAAAGEGPTVLVLQGGGRGAVSLWWSRGVFSVATSAPAAEAVALMGGVPAASAQGIESARAAVGVEDEDGMLVWVELPDGVAASGQTARAMDALLARIGCTSRMMVPGGARALLGGTLDAAGEPARQATRVDRGGGGGGGATPTHEPAAPPTHETNVRLIRDRAPDAHPMFTDTPIVPLPVWQPLQAKRVRYFYKPAPAPSASASNTTAPSSPPGAANRAASPQ
jgi:hypothetical protein